MTLSDHINRNLTALCGPILPSRILREGQHHMELASCTAILVPPATPGANETLAFRWKFISMSQVSLLGECYTVWTALGETFEESPLYSFLHSLMPGLTNEAFYELNLDDLIERHFQAHLVHRTTDTGKIYVDHTTLSVIDLITEIHDQGEYLMAGGAR